MKLKGDGISIHLSDKFYEQTNAAEMAVPDLYPDNMPVGRGCARITFSVPYSYT